MSLFYMEEWFVCTKSDAERLSLSCNKLKGLNLRGSCDLSVGRIIIYRLLSFKKNFRHTKSFKISVLNIKILSTVRLSCIFVKLLSFFKRFRFVLDSDEIRAFLDEPLWRVHDRDECVITCNGSLATPRSEHSEH